MTSVVGMRELVELRFLGKNTGFVINVKATNQNFYLKMYLKNYE